jgi:2-dehydro-3-deoxygluconokinase
MDLVTFGEAMLRLTPESSRRLEDARRFDAYVGGSELNVAVGAARLGLRTRWVSRLPENALGRTVSNRARELGVDVSCVVWSTSDRLGLYFVELAEGAGGRASEVVYDRAGSAMACITPGTIDWKHALSGASWFHVSGITPALSGLAAATLAESLDAAKAASLTVSYDLNFRPKLWSAEEARRVQEPLMPYVDLLIASESAAGAVFGVAGGGVESVARALQERSAVPAVAVTSRDVSSSRSTIWRAAVVAEGRTHCSPEMQVEVQEPIGAGDAFAAGLIYRRLKQGAWDEALRHGAALVTLKYRTPGDFSQATLGDVEELLVRTPGSAPRMAAR